MAKESGLGMTITIDDNTGAGQDLSNDITSCEVSTPRGTLDVTGVDKLAFERLLGLADGSATFNSIFNDAANRSHAVFKTLPASTAVSRTCVLAHSGQTLTMELLLTDYPISRGDDGKLGAAVPGVLADGVAPAWT
jgi:hypothetical protein